jgi:alcohol dehydrogenase class IV
MAANPPYLAPGEGETVFSVSAAPIKFGPGALGEVGADAQVLGMTRVALFVDPRVRAGAACGTVQDALRAAGVDVVVYDQVRCEPNSESFEAAAAFARDGAFDGFVSLGGGSVMDTAKAANLLSSYPDELIAYVNAPIGRAKPIPGRLKPHIACPTTCGTGSETTGIAIVDVTSVGLKTGIASPLLKPSLAIVDPTTTETLPGGVVAASGFDVRHFAAAARPKLAASSPRSAATSESGGSSPAACARSSSASSARARRTTARRGSSGPPLCACVACRVHTNARHAAGRSS